MNLTEDDKSIEEAAVAFAKSNRRKIAKQLTNIDIYPAEKEPISVFMAGSPGAGKTEASIALMDRIEPQDSGKTIRIDPDELRSEFEQYKGGNAYLFQRGVSILVEKIHDVVLKQKQSFLLDGTLANFNVAEKNIQRSVKKGRGVYIIYVYQEPRQAWAFVQAREKVEGRKIMPEHFINQYFSARDTVNQLKSIFAKKITIDILLKNIDGSDRLYQANILNVDSFIPEKYTRSQLENLIS